MVLVIPTLFALLQGLNEIMFVMGILHKCNVYKEYLFVRIAEIASIQQRAALNQASFYFYFIYLF